MASSQHQNGGAEVLIKLAKGVMKSIMQELGEQKLTLNEPNTVLMETAQIVNSRPIGIKPNKDTDFEYLSPIHYSLGKIQRLLIMGHFTVRVIQLLALKLIRKGSFFASR